MKYLCYLSFSVFVLFALTGCNAQSGANLSPAANGSPSTIDGVSEARGGNHPLDGNDTALPGPFKHNQSLLTGRQLFEVHCSGCHPGGENRMQPNKPVLGSSKLASFQQFSHYLLNPGPGMQVFSLADLPDIQRQQLYAALQDAQMSLHKPVASTH